MKKVVCLFIVFVIIINTNVFAWEIKNYVNEFDEPTQDAYITSTKFKATQFNNVTSYESNAEIFFDDYGMYITLYDASKYSIYGPSIKKAAIDTIYYIDVTDKTGTHYYEGSMQKGEDRVYLNNQTKNEILGMIMSNDIIYVTLTDTYQKSTYHSTYEEYLISDTIFNYKFTVSQRNMNELFAQAQRLQQTQ